MFSWSEKSNDKARLSSLHIDFIEKESDDQEIMNCSGYMFLDIGYEKDGEFVPVKSRQIHFDEEEIKNILTGIQTTKTFGEVKSKAEKVLKGKLGIS